MIRLSAPAIALGVAAFCIAILFGIATLDRPIVGTTAPPILSQPTASGHADGTPSASRTPPRLADGYRGTWRRFLSGMLGLVVIVAGDIVLAIPVGRHLAGAAADPSEWLMTTVVGVAAIVLGIYFLFGAFA